MTESSDHRRDARADTQSAWLLDRARQAFEQRGYHGTCLGGVARSAGVSVDRLRAVFGSTEAMYLAVMYEPLPEVEPTSALPSAVGEQVLRRYLALRQRGRNNEVMLTLIKAAHTREGAAAAVRQLLEGVLLEPLGNPRQGTDLWPRIAATSVVLLGLTLAVDVVRVQPLACADDATLLEWLGPIVDLAARGELSA